MTVNNKSFVLLASLFTSGLLLCTPQQTNGEVKGGRDWQDRGVGIHLGMTHSSVGVLKHPFPREGLCRADRQQCAPPLSNADIIEVVKNERGSRTTPSCVAFTDSGEVLVGEPAKEQAAANPERTICGITRLMGKKFEDPDVQSYIKTLPYKVVNMENKPVVQVKFRNGETKMFSLEEICAMILGKMKEMAEAYMGNEAGISIVLVHPSYFNNEELQRGYFNNEGLQRSIKEAGKIVGLKVDHAHDSTTAATLARRKWPQENFRVLVYNLGGIAFDVRLIDDDGAFGLVSARGDMHLGGQAFDWRVVEHFINLVRSKYHKDISKDSVAVAKLRAECEKAKISLSESDQVMINIESLADGIVSFEEPLTRKTFEELNMDLFNKTVELVREVMNEGRTNETGIDEIVLVGGNARIPKIQQMLKELLGMEFLNDVNPDEAMAFAATHSAGFHYGLYGRRDGRRIYQVSNTMDVGIETVGGIMTTYINTFWDLPRLAGGYITTYHDEQTCVEIKVFEGARYLTKHCHHLGTLKLSDLPPAPRGALKIKVIMELDLDSNIRVTAEHKPSQRRETMTIPVQKRYNAIEKIKQVVAEYPQAYKKDKAEIAKIEEAIKMGTLQPDSADSLEFAVVNTRLHGRHVKLRSLNHTRVSSTTHNRMSMRWPLSH